MSDELQQRVGRPCSICTSASRSEVELALTGGDLISRIAATFDLSRAAIRRHRDRHMSWSAEQIHDAGLDAVTITLRLAEVAERAREAAEEAREAGRIPEMIRSGDAELRALSVLHQLGFRHERAIGELRSQQMFTQAMRAAIREQPALGVLLADHFEAADVPEVAKAIRGFVSRNKELQQ